MSSSISMAGMGTGLDVYGMAETMASSQTAAKSNQLTEKETELNAELTALQTIDSALNGFINTLNLYADPSTFGTVTANVSGGASESVGVDIDSDAVPNTYQLDVTQLATQHKVEVVNTNGSDDPAEIAPGDYTLSVGEDEFSITVEAGANSYANVAQQINEDPNNPGITAGVMSDGDDSYFTLTANDSGFDNTIAVYNDSVAPNEELPTKELQAAQDAVFKIDGIEMTSPDNSIDDAIEGVTLNLKDVTTDPDEGGPVTITIEPDRAVMEESINAIIDSFNGVMTTVDNLTETTYDEEGNPVRPALAGDSMLSSIERELKDILYQSYDDTFSNLASVGIVSDSNGKLEVDDEVLTEALEEDADAVADMFLDDGGLIDGWQTVTEKYVGRAEEMTDGEGNPIDPNEDPNDGYVSSTGMIDDRVDGLREDLDDVEDEWAVLEARYESIYQRHLEEYIAMDVAVAEMNSSYAFL